MYKINLFILPAKLINVNDKTYFSGIIHINLKMNNK